MIVYHADQRVGELQNGIFCGASVHAEGLAGEAGNIGGVYDRFLVYRRIDHFHMIHAVEAVVCDAVIFGTEAHEVVIVVEDERHGIHLVALFVFAVNAVELLVQVEIVEGEAAFLLQCVLTGIDAVVDLHYIRQCDSLFLQRQRIGLSLLEISIYLMRSECRMTRIFRG